MQCDVMIQSVLRVWIRTMHRYGYGSLDWETLARKSLVDADVGIFLDGTDTLKRFEVEIQGDCQSNRTASRRARSKIRSRTQRLPSTSPLCPDPHAHFETR